MPLRRAAVLLLFASSSLVIVPSLNANGYHHQSSYQSSFHNEQQFGASEQQPIVNTKTTYNGCTSATGCGGVTLENGKVVHKYGNPAAIGVQGGEPEGLNPTELHNKFAVQAADVNSAFGAGLPADGPFWWAKANSPFKNAHEAYMKWIKDGFAGVTVGSTCGLCAANSQVSGDVNGAIASNSIDITNNPFLNGQFAAAFSSSGGSAPSGPSGFGSSGSKEVVDISSNPFLNGNIKPGQASSSFQTSFESQTPGLFNIANNPFLNGGISGGGFTSGGCSGPSASGSGSCGASAVLQQTGSTSQQFGSTSSQFGVTTSSGQSGCGSGGCGSAGGSAGGSVYQSGSVTTQDYNKPSTPSQCGPGGCGGSGFVHQSGSVTTQDYNKQSTPGQCGPGGCGPSGFVHQSGSVTTQDYNKPSTPSQCGPGGCGSSGFVHQSGSVSSQDYNKPSTPSQCGPGGCGSTGFVHQSGSVSSQDYNKQSTPNYKPQTSTGFAQQTGSVSGQNYNKPAGVTPSGCGGPGGSCNYQGQEQITTQFTQQSACTGPYCGQEQQTQPPYKPNNKPPTNVPHPPGATNQGFRETGSNSGELTVSCNGQDRVCVPKHLCINGQINEDGENIIQFRGSSQCKTSSEVCCKLRKPTTNQEPYSPGGNLLDSTSLQSSVSNVVSGSNSYTPGVTFVPGSQRTTGGQDQSFFTRPGTGASLRPGIPYLPPVEAEPTTQPPYQPPRVTPPKVVQTPTPTTRPTPTTAPYRPPTQPPTRPPTQPPTRSTPARTPPPYIPPKTNPPPYLPPKEDERPQSSIGSQQIVPGPEKGDSEGQLLLEENRSPPKKVTPIIPREPPAVVHAACAAALKCTPIELCTAEGVISNTTVILTKEQEEFRVPMTDCKDVDTGVTGKCCRDPTYTDPWPTNQLGKWVPSAFGDTGAYKAENYRNGNNGRNNGRPPSNNGGAGVVPGAKPEGSINRPIFTSNPNPPPPKNPYNPNTKTPPKQLNNFFPPPPQQNNPRVPDSFTSGQLQLENYRQCGVRKPGVPPGNKNNLEVDFGEIPWQAMVLLETNRSLLCGGIITAPDAVVTSAHCIDGLEPKSIMIKGGEWKLGIDEEPKPFQIVRVSQVMKHPAYQPGNMQYDLAVLMLEEKLRFADHINQICLPPKSTPEVHQKKTQCITTGWGKQVLQVNIPNSVMHSVDLNILPPQQCQGQISQNYPHLLEQYNPNNCICGQPVKGNICKVDIGSALACTGPDGSYYMEGVYSWDAGCTSPVQLASFFKFDAQWYENAMESASSQSQRYETVQHSNQVYKRQYETAQIAQPTQIHTYTVSGHPGQSQAQTGRQSFNQAIGGHVHTGADCHCLPGKK